MEWITSIIWILKFYPVGPIDGLWGSWADWSKCSKSCGGGLKARQRLCDSPAPAHGGADCQGDHSQERQCNTQPCPPVPGKQLVFTIYSMFGRLDDLEAKMENN